MSDIELTPEQKRLIADADRVMELCKGMLGENGEQYEPQTLSEVVYIEQAQREARRLFLMSLTVEQKRALMAALKDGTTHLYDIEP